MNTINQDYIEEYIRRLLPKNTNNILELQNYAEKNHVPIIHPEVAQLITVLLKNNNSKKLLEIGTAIGFSAIIFSKAMGKNSKIVTIERDHGMIRIAKDNISNMGLENNINILEGQAENLLPTIDEKFDCIFLDAAKGHYMDFLPKSLSLLKENGLLISDNVLFRGMVASDKLVKRRKITIVKRMRKYLNYISNHSKLITSVIPIGDGLAVSIKRSGE